jgi:hypothetical protein
MIVRWWTLLLAETAANAPKPGDWRFGWAGVGMVAAGALAIILCAWLVTRWLASRQRQINNSPWCLFKDLAAAHGLNHRERQLLTRLAQHFRLEQPSALFVEAAWWEADRLGPSWARCQSDLDKLRRRLFAVR